MKLCSGKLCVELGIHKRQSSLYCDKCWRFQCMRNGAKAKNKYVPSNKELNDLILENMTCPICKKIMIWNKQLGDYNDVISLQHNLDGTILLICMECNNGHGHSKLGDKYFDMPKDCKYCPRCDTILNKIEFYKTKNNNLCSECKICQRVRSKSVYKKRLNHNKGKKSWLLLM